MLFISGRGVERTVYIFLLFMRCPDDRSIGSGCGRYGIETRGEKHVAVTARGHEGGGEESKRSRLENTWQESIVQDFEASKRAKGRAAGWW